MLRIAVALVGVVAAAGCNSILGIDDLSLRDGGGGDTPTGDSGDCDGHFVPVCLGNAPAGSLTLATDIDTDADPRCTTITQAAPGAPDACALAGTSIEVTADIDVVGSRPLILVATTTISLDNKLDAGSHVGERAGPGASFGGCAVISGGTASTAGGTGAGGGAGGSFGTMGGHGGAGDGGPTEPMALPAEAPPTFLRGGCPGAAGGANTATGGGAGGLGGAGGGAVYLIAGTSITINDELRASGSGGHGGMPLNAGGGGAGTGGMIVLEAPTITIAVDGEINANGGGGGEGGKGSAGDDGHDDAAWNAAATGGTGHNDQGDGGDGAYGMTPATPGVDGMHGGGGGAGGGGGGGGAGVVLYHGSIGGNVSPPPNTF